MIVWINMHPIWQDPKQNLPPFYLKHYHLKILIYRIFRTTGRIWFLEKRNTHFNSVILIKIHDWKCQSQRRKSCGGKTWKKSSELPIESVTWMKSNVNSLEKSSRRRASITWTWREKPFRTIHHQNRLTFLYTKIYTYRNGYLSLEFYLSFSTKMKKTRPWDEQPPTTDKTQWEMEIVYPDQDHEIAHSGGKVWTKRRTSTTPISNPTVGTLLTSRQRAPSIENLSKNTSCFIIDVEKTKGTFSGTLLTLYRKGW